MADRVLGGGGLVFAIVAAMGLATTALAQSSADDLARAHFQAASAYYEQGRYEDAAREFSHAYRLSQRPALLENVARSYERALLFDEAIAALRQLAEAEPGHIAAPVLEERIQNLERLRARVRGAGEEPPAPSATPATSAPPAPRDPAPARAATPSDGGVSVSGIAVLATGGALGLGSILTGVVSHSMYEDVSGACTGDLCPTDRQGDIDTGNALAITSTVLMFTSIAALGVGIVLLIVDQGGGGAEQGHAGRVELTPGPGEAGLGMQVRF